MQQPEHSSPQAEASQPWYRLESTCIHCGKDDFSPEYGPRTLLECSCCGARGTHVECFEEATGKEMTEDMLNSGSMWFCCQSCEEVSGYIESNIGVRMSVRGESAEYTLELVKYDKDSRGAKSTVDAAIRIFRESFDPLIMDNGQELVAMCCTSYESPDEGEHVENSDGEEEDSEGYNYSAFRVVALRKGNTIVSVATLRLFGTRLAEMPFVATRQGFRRAGHCRRLIKGVEDILRRLHVSWLVLPSIRSVLPMWRYNFNFMPLTLEEQASLEPHIVSPDFDSAQLVKKRMWPPPAAAAGAGRRGRGRPAATAAATDAVDGAPKTRGQVRGRGRGRGSSKAAAAAARESDRDEADQQAGSLRYSFRSKGRGRPGRRISSAVDSGGSGAEGDSDSSDAEQDPAVAAEEAEAAAAWAAFEATAGKTKAGFDDDDSSSSSSDDDDDDDDDDDNGGKANRKRRRAGGSKRSRDKDNDWQGDAEGSSSSDSDDAGLVSENEDDSGVTHKKQKQHQQLPGATAAAAPATSTLPLTAAATAEEEAAALMQLRKDIAAAGGQLPETGWTVRLTGRLPGGAFKSRAFIELVTGRVHRSVLAVKRTLGLTPAAAGRQQGGAGGGLSDALKAWDLPPAAAGAATAGAGNSRRGSQMPSAAAIFASAGMGTIPPAAAGKAGQGPAKQQFSYNFSTAGYQKHQQRLAEQAALKRLRVGRAKRRMSREAFLGLCLADAIKRCYRSAAEQLARPEARQGLIDCDRGVAASLLKADVTAAASVLDQQQQHMLRQQALQMGHLQQRAVALKQHQQELQDRERQLQQREQQLKLQQQQLQALMQQLNSVNSAASEGLTGSQVLPAGFISSAQCPAPLAADSAQAADAADCMLLHGSDETEVQVFAAEQIAAYPTAPSAPLRSIQTAQRSSDSGFLQQKATEALHLPVDTQPDEMTAAPVLPTAAVPVRETKARLQQGSANNSLADAAAASAAVIAHGRDAAALQSSQLPADLAGLADTSSAAATQSVARSGPAQQQELQRPLQLPATVAEQKPLTDLHATKNLSVTGAVLETAAVTAVAAATGGSVSGTSLTKSPRLSDSFLSGLLPQVVGQILVTPCSKFTAAVMPNTSTNRHHQPYLSGLVQQHRSGIGNPAAESEQQQVSDHAPAVAVGGGEQPADAEPHPTEYTSDKQQTVALQTGQCSSLSKVSSAAIQTTATKNGQPGSCPSSPVHTSTAAAALAASPLKDITAAVNNAPSCVDHDSDRSIGSGAPSPISANVCGVKAPAAAQPHALTAADKLRTHNPKVNLSLIHETQQSRKRPAADGTKPPAGTVVATEAQHAHTQARQLVATELLPPNTREHGAAVTDAFTATKKARHNESSSDKQLQPAVSRKRPSAVLQCFGELAMLGGLTGLASSSSSSAELSGSGSGRSSIGAGSGRSRSSVSGDSNRAASGTAAADRTQCQTLACPGVQSRPAAGSADNIATKVLEEIQVNNTSKPAQDSMSNKQKSAPEKSIHAVPDQCSTADNAGLEGQVSAAASIATKQPKLSTSSKQSVSATGCSSSSDHTSTSDTGEGLSGGLMDMFESVAADMMRDGMLPDSHGHNSSRGHPAVAAAANLGTSEAGEAVTAGDGGMQELRFDASGPAAAAAMAGAARSNKNVLTRFVLPPSGLRRSPALPTSDLLAKALPVWQSPAVSLQAVVAAEAAEPETTIPTTEAAGAGAVLTVTRSVSADAADTHAALDTAALFAFAGDLDDE